MYANAGTVESKDAFTPAADKAESARKEGMSALLFIEMLFWKNAHDSGEVRDEYRWRVSTCYCLMRSAWGVLCACKSGMHSAKTSST